MTYDTAVWKPDNDLRSPSAEFDRRCDASDARYPQVRRPVPELARLADLLEAEFTGPSATTGGGLERRDAQGVRSSSSTR